MQFIRELLDRQVLHMLAWFDTRDMSADGLTKGAVERTAIHSIMDGTMKVNHEPKVWTSRKGGRNIPEALPSNNTDEVWFTYFSDRSHSLAQIASSAHLSPSSQHTMAFAAAAQQWKPTLRCPEGGASAPSAPEAPGNPDSGVHVGDGGNNPEVPSTPAEPPTGPAWIPSETWDGTTKHYSQRAFKGQQSNVRFGKAREDIEAYAQGVEPFEDTSATRCSESPSAI